MGACVRPRAPAPIALAFALGSIAVSYSPAAASEAATVHEHAFDRLEGAALFDAIAALATNGHRRLSYAELWEALEYTDEVRDDPASVRLLYSGRAQPKADKVSARLNPDHGPDSWNREHVWPRAQGFPSARALAHNDLHHVRAADVTCNADRGSLDFDDGGAELGDCRARRDDDSFEPRAAVKGDIARMLFYMDVRYNGADATPDLRLVDGDAARRDRPELGYLCTLVAWHRGDPVDDDERFRHERIAEMQGNRNPFVDHPELVARVFADRCR